MGKWRHRIRFHNPTRVDDGAGGYSRSDPSSGTLAVEAWGHVEADKASEVFRGFRHDESVQYVVTVRYNVLIKDGCVIEWDGRQFHGQTVVDPDGLKQFLVIAMREKGGGLYGN
jgi:SPP1 family predicted phage head-tail adaptor